MSTDLMAELFFSIIMECANLYIKLLWNLRMSRRIFLQTTVLTVKLTQLIYWIYCSWLQEWFIVWF